MVNLKTRDIEGYVRAAEQRIREQVKLPENYFNKVVILPLKYGLGHPVDRHPVSDVMDPSNVSQVKTQVNCLSCHQPHSSTQAGLLVKDQANNMAFCSSCHKSFVR